MKIKTELSPDSNKLRTSALPEDLEKHFLRLKTELSTCFRFRWVFAVFGDSYLRQKIIDELERDLTQSIVSVAHVKEMFELEDLLEEKARLVNCIHVTDTRYLFENTDYDWPNRLNLRRNSLAKIAPINVVFWMDDEHVTLLANQAPDFWNWRSGVYEFVIKNMLSNLLVVLPEALSSSPAPKELKPKRKAEIVQRLRNKTDFTISEADLLVELASHLEKSGNLGESEEKLEKAQIIYEKFGDTESVESVLFKMLVVAEKGQNYKKVQDLLARIISSQTQRGDIQALSLTYKYCGEFEKRHDNQEQALRNFEESLSLSKQVINTFSTISPKLDDIKTNIDVSNYPKARANIEFVIENLLKGGHISMAADMLKTLSRIETIEGNFNNAIQHLQKSHELHLQANQKRELSITSFSLGTLFFLKEETNLALTHLKDALKLNKSIQNNIERGRCLGQLGLVYLYMGFLDQAKYHLQESSEIFKHENQTKLLSMTLTLLLWSNYISPTNTIDEQQEIFFEIQKNLAESANTQAINFFHNIVDDNLLKTLFSQPSLNLSFEK